MGERFEVFEGIAQPPLRALAQVMQGVVAGIDSKPTRPAGNQIRPQARVSATQNQPSERRGKAGPIA